MQDLIWLLDLEAEDEEGREGNWERAAMRELVRFSLI